MLICAHAGQIPLPDESVQCVVTSPPYWGLRKYAGEQELIWGADGCEHEWGNGRDEEQPIEKRVAWLRTAVAQGCICVRCGAWRGAYGLEPTIEMYVAHTVEILREVRRVLRPDGVCWWNLGDSYATGAGSARVAGGKCFGKSNAIVDSGDFPSSQPNRMPQAGLKPKDLCLIPSRVALAAQADGWWVRSMIVWAKPNPMPESVQDRPTDAYEHIIMLTKSERYYWDADAVREPMAGAAHGRGGDPNGQTVATYHTPGAISRDTLRPWGNESGRNLRNVWTFPTQRYLGHFATFPEEIPRRCIKAASKPGDLVLDPFGGSGTTGRVAIEMQRRPILLDLAYAHDYAPLAKARTSKVQIEAFV